MACSLDICCLVGFLHIQQWQAHWPVNRGKERHHQQTRRHPHPHTKGWSTDDAKRKHTATHMHATNIERLPLCRVVDANTQSAEKLCAPRQLCSSLNSMPVSSYIKHMSRHLLVPLLKSMHSQQTAEQRNWSCDSLRVCWLLLYLVQ